MTRARRCPNRAIMPPVTQSPDAPLADDTPHLLVVDDDEGIRTLLSRYLRREGYMVTAAKDAVEASRTLGALDFDAIVLDVMMPGEDGVSLTRRLREGSAVPILLLTARDAPEDRINGLEAGADDYLAKPFEPRELALRLERLLSRRPQTDKSAPLVFGDNVLDLRKGTLTRGGEAVRLTGAEVTLLRTLAAKPGAAISRSLLAEKTGGHDRSVDVQVTRLRRKIEDDPRTPEHLQTVRGVGYALVLD